MKPLFVAIAVTAVAAALWGCGGSDSGSGATVDADAVSNVDAPSGQISNVVFARRVRAICAQGKRLFLKEAANYLKSHGSEANPSQKLLASEVRAVILPGLLSQVRQIRALKAPRGDKAKIDAWLDAMEEALEASFAAPGLAVLDYGENLHRAGDLANGYNLHRCAYG